MVRRHDPFGLFMADSCRIYETVGNFCLNFLAKVICFSSKERTNDWMKVLSYKYQGNDNNNKNNRTLRVRCAFQYLLLDFYFYCFLFAKRKRRQCCSFSLKRKHKKKVFEMEYLFRAWTWIVDDRSAGSRDMSSAKSVSEMGKSVAHSQRCECGQ